MDDRKVALLGGIFLVCLLVLGGAGWFKQRSDREARIDACVAMLGEQGRDKCEQMEARR